VVLVVALIAPSTALLRAELSATIVLSEPLAEWKREIEETGTGRVILARVYTDHERNLLILPSDAQQRPALRRYFLNDSFVKAFVTAHAVNINYEGIEGKFHFILLNMVRAGEWHGLEEAVLAHEFGHVWLYARGYPFPVYEGRADSCVSIVAGDTLQHILVREEIRRRSIPYLPYWLGKLDTSLEELERTAHNARNNIPVCHQMAQLALWLDVRLGLSPEQWNNYDRFLEAMEQNSPALKPHVEGLYELLRRADVRDRDVHLRTLQKVLLKMYALADSLAGSESKPDVTHGPTRGQHESGRAP